MSDPRVAEAMRLFDRALESQAAGDGVQVIRASLQAYLTQLLQPTEPTGVLMERRLQSPTDLCENEWWPWEEVFAPHMTKQQPDTFEYAWFERAAHPPVQPTELVAHNEEVDAALAYIREAQPLPDAAESGFTPIKQLEQVDGRTQERSPDIQAFVESLELPKWSQVPRGRRAFAAYAIEQWQSATPVQPTEPKK